MVVSSDCLNTDLNQYPVKERKLIAAPVTPPNTAAASEQNEQEIIAKRLSQAIEDAEDGRLHSTAEVFGEIVKNLEHKKNLTVDKKSIRIVNSMLLAMHSLQKDMKGEAEKAALTTNESVVELIENLRKEQALRTFESIGISASDAIRVFLTRTIAEQRIPFELKAARTPVFADNLEPEKLREEILKGKVAIDEGRYLPADEAFSQIKGNLGESNKK